MVTLNQEIPPKLEVDFDRLKFCLPRLPDIVQENILVIAAMESRCEASKLCRISKYLNRLLTPVLYHTVRTDHPITYTVLFITIRENPSIALHIRNLHIDYLHGQFTLSLCLNVQRLVFHGTVICHGFTIDTEKWPAPWEAIFFGIMDPSQCRSWFHHPTFRNVTHLALAEIPITEFEKLDAFQSFGLLPKLTHLAIGEGPETSQAHLQNLLDHTPSLRLLLLIISEDLSLFPGSLGRDDAWSLYPEINYVRIVRRPHLEENELVSCHSPWRTIWEDTRLNYAFQTAS